MKLQTLRPMVSVLDTRAAPLPKKVADPFYLSAAWRALMVVIIKKRGRRCQECGRTGCRVYGDHIVELQDGGAPLDEANVWLRCGSCHTQKTADQRARRQATPAGG